MTGEQDRGIEEDELRDELRRARSQLEREPPPERVPDERCRARTDGGDDRVDVCPDVPRRLPGRVAVPEKVGSEDVVAREARCELREVTSVVADSVEADDARRAGLAPLVEGERHSVVARTSSVSGTISVRRSSRSFTSDQITVPSWSMRNVPRCGEPFASLKTP